ncbi:MAG: ferritin family protein [Candidatus Delongbacteria bacterium]|nr:ferritin family protein [Candidatus Delongbacteria bacterium]MBN2835820.1 ferritin family protein [Candidatus Delongbacteria bacterium]
MDESKTLITLKQGIILEKKGMEFFRKVASQVEDPKVKEFFNEMAEEEVVHYGFLTDLYNGFKSKGYFDSEITEKAKGMEVVDSVMDKEMINKIEAASFESAAIDAAIEFEKRAIELYSNRAKEADDANEKHFYEFLADWETNHLNDLEEIGKQLKEKIWHDNKFWAF